jgi:hypothetical protein
MSFLLNVGYEVRTGLSTVCGGKKKEKMACFVLKVVHL